MKRSVPQRLPRLHGQWLHFNLVKDVLVKCLNECKVPSFHGWVKRERDEPNGKCNCGANGKTIDWGMMRLSKRLMWVTTLLTLLHTSTVLAKVIQVDTNRLIEMLPSRGVTHQPRPIKLCGACYAEVPCHRIEWQVKSAKVIVGCDRHQLRLLSNCPGCKQPFPIPALWIEGKCKHSSLPFAKMARFQRSL